MRPLTWLHISDIHKSLKSAWSQDIVLKALCDDVVHHRADGPAADFILVTGDLAFSGKHEEYALVAAFFDALSTGSGVAKERIFCIPGNHDIQRDRQQLCFQGARADLQDESRIDILLAAKDDPLVASDDLETLLKRQEAYRHFQSSYFADQTRTPTACGLGYVSQLTIDDVQLAIVGLDSAWLAEGGEADHGNLLIGERQVIDALNLAQTNSDPPNIIIIMAHHPFHLLRNFDRQRCETRAEMACHFFHCGHLHEPATRIAGHSRTRCLTVAAGASFATRESRNTYALMHVDLQQARTTATTVHYEPLTGTFKSRTSDDFPVAVSPADMCSVDMLAQAIKSYSTVSSPCAHYLSALLLDKKNEMPILTSNGVVFGSFEALESQPDSDLKRKTIAFMTFRNVLRVLYRRVSLAEILSQHDDAVEQYGAALEHLCDSHPPLRGRLVAMESDARDLAEVDPSGPFSHTSELLADLASERNWDLLREHARRHLNSSDQASAIYAMRMLTLGLANSTDVDLKMSAIELYRSLADGSSADISDSGNLIVLLTELGRLDEAKIAVLNGIKEFSAVQSDYFLEIGQMVVEATGDKDFRLRLEAAMVERGRRG